jgi:hypothetical protein
MTENAGPILASSLAAAPEWTATHPGAELVWEDHADEGEGIGFDGLDPSAMVRAIYQVDDPWEDILSGYRARLDAGGWVGEEVSSEWWSWHHPDHHRLTFDLLRRAMGPGTFRPPGIRDGATVFEVIYRCRPSTGMPAGPATGPAPSSDA